MTPEQKLALTLAVYGAILSSLLAIVQLIRWIQDFRKERRQVRVFLEYVAWYEHAQIVITNSGHRPVTITEVGIAIPHKLEDRRIIWEDVPRNSLLRGMEEPFPTTLKDGDALILPLSDVVSGYVYPSMRVQVSVFDSEGNRYTRYKARLYDPKWGHYVNMKKGTIPTERHDRVNGDR